MLIYDMAFSPRDRSSQANGSEPGNAFLAFYKNGSFVSRFSIPGLFRGVFLLSRP